MTMPFNLYSLKSKSWVAEAGWSQCRTQFFANWGTKAGVVTSFWVCTESKGCWLLCKTPLCQIERFHKKLTCSQFFLSWWDKLTNNHILWHCACISTRHSLSVINADPTWLSGVWEGIISPQKSPWKNHEPKHDPVWLASQHLSQADGNEAQQDLLEEMFPGSGKAFRTKAGAASCLFLRLGDRVVPQV